MEHHFSCEAGPSFVTVTMTMAKFDFFAISASSEPLREIMADRGYPSTLFDFSQVAYIDSSVFGFLIEIRSPIVKAGHRIAIVCSNPGVLHIMDMLKVPLLIKVFPGRTEAEGYLTGNDQP